MENHALIQITVTFHAKRITEDDEYDRVLDLLSPIVYQLEDTFKIISRDAIRDIQDKIEGLDIETEV